jgi:hypothetical protein
VTLVYDKETWRASVQNGAIALAKLDEIYPMQFDRDLGGPALMHPEAASAMSTMLQAAAEQGFPDLAVSLSYRTLAKQEEKWADFQAGGNLAARPGTSNHGWAVACDMRWGRLVTLTWLQVNAPKYGFINDVPSENWHYTFQEGLWNGDDVTEEQLRKLNEAADRGRGEDAFWDAWLKNDGDPGPVGIDKPPAFRKGWSNTRKGALTPKPGTTHIPDDVLRGGDTVIVVKNP